jgi:Tol biopolymer transport system component
MEEDMKRSKDAILALLSVSAVLLAAMAHPGLTLASQPGAGPENALTPAADWQPLARGEIVWYTFQYAGDGSPIDIRLQVEPAGGAAFALWTPEGIRDRGLGLEAEPIGRGSADPHAAGSLVWSGSFTTRGAYYVTVEFAGSQPGKSYYLLEVQGSGVSFSAPAATPEATPTPAKNTPPKSSTPATITGKLVFQTSVGGPIYVINADGGERGSLGLRRLADGIDPTWSPDGKQVAFVRWREPRGVWIAEADGSNEWRAFDENLARWPSWSPDGSQILFSRQHGGQMEDAQRCFFGFCFTIPARPHWKLGIVETDGSDFYEPPSSDFSQAPDWSPAGDRIVYSDEQGLRVQDRAGEVSYLITHDANDTSPVWSPDGQRVAFTRRQHDHWEVYVVDADGRNLRRLTDTPLNPSGQVANSVAPAWSPDGQSLAFLTDRAASTTAGGKWQIWVMQANGQQQRPLFAGALDGLTLEYGFVGERALSWSR